VPDARDRGRYKIFLGMAAGVGKTYRMLQEGQAEAEAGRDVVVGLVETHGRAETAALIEGLEVLPRRRVPYRGTELEEMDLPALLERLRAAGYGVADVRVDRADLHAVFLHLTGRELRE